MPAVMPTVRMSSTPGRPLSVIAASAQSGSSCFARSNRLLVAVEIERRETGRAGERMRRIGVAVEQLDHMLRAAHEGIVDAFARDDAAHRHGAGGHALGEADHVRASRRSVRPRRHGRAGRSR